MHASPVTVFVTPQRAESSVARSAESRFGYPALAQESRTNGDHPKATQLRCPVCPDSGLHARELKSGVLVDSCPKCRGTWLGAGELLQLSRNKETARQGTVAVAWEPVASDRACPQCKIPMHEGEFLDSNVFLDCCGNCDGLWFDAKELDAKDQVPVFCQILIAHFLGGLIELLFLFYRCVVRWQVLISFSDRRRLPVFYAQPPPLS